MGLSGSAGRPANGQNSMVQELKRVVVEMAPIYATDTKSRRAKSLKANYGSARFTAVLDVWRAGCSCRWWTRVLVAVA